MTTFQIILLIMYCIFSMAYMIREVYLPDSTTTMYIFYTLTAPVVFLIMLGAIVNCILNKKYDDS